MVKINARNVNPFIEAAMRVVAQIAGIEVRRGHLSYKERVEPSFGISIVVGIHGFLSGMVVYSMPEQLAGRLADRLLEGRSPQERKILFLDCLGEVANMITGNATALLNQGRDRVLNMTTPAILTGNDRGAHLPPKAALVLGLITMYGPIEVSIAIEENETLQEAGALSGPWPAVPSGAFDLAPPAAMPTARDVVGVA